MTLLDPLRPYLALIRAGLLVAALAGVGILAYRYGGAADDDELAAQARTIKSLGDSLAAAQAEHKRLQSQAVRLAAIAEQYEQDRLNADAKHDQVVADLRAGAVRLRRAWRCEMPPAGAATAAAGSDGDAELRTASAARIVRIGAEADAQLRACQAVVNADRAR